MSLSSASVLERDFVTPGVWRVIASVGPDPVDDPDSADAAASADHVTVAVRGRALDGPDQRMLSLFALQAALTLEQQRLTDAAAAAEPLAEADRMRTALLSAVSHDLRSPLASATAAVDSLSNSAIQWTPEQRADLIATAKESLDQLSRLVDNLLDMSRLQAGALSVFPQPTRLDEVVPLALDSLGPSAAKVEIDMAADLPEVRADPALLERVIANVAANAIRYADGGRAPRVAASAHGDRVELRIIDHGPGVPSTEWDRIFTPFQRLGDTDNTVGVGLGLALARGLAEAMGGHLNPEETPGGGLTMVVDLPTAQVGRPVSVINDEVTA
jgi:two-component system, OmpR family, sensor histidine kinase KdpD